MTLISPLPLPCPSTSSTDTWWWTAEHLRGRWGALEPCWEAARMVVGAVDGDRWPYTIVETRRDDVTARFFQVLGGLQGCYVEVGGNGLPWRAVVRISSAAREGWVELPKDCGYWIPKAFVRSDEVLTPDEATALGIAWLQGRSPEGEWATRRPRALRP